MSDTYKSPPVGQEISCVMKGLKKEFLVSSDGIFSFAKETLEKEGFGIIDIFSHNFPGQGFTLFALLSESHLAIHTYPEHNSIYFNMYSCRGPKDAENIFSFFKKKLSPKKILFLKKDEVPVEEKN